jgi:8-oxo-dGTP diphosphatase
MSSLEVPVHVAVAVILDRQLKILLTRRAADAHQGGLWEFPGGKVEAGESVFAALARELKEELDIVPLHSSPLLQVRHDYPDRVVVLDVHVVWDFDGVAVGKEAQPLAWVGRDHLDEYAFPAANREILDALGTLLADTADKAIQPEADR